MGGPTKRPTQVQEEAPEIKTLDMKSVVEGFLAGRESIVKASREPKKYNVVLDDIGLTDDRNFYGVIGHLDLQPYVWLELEEDQGKSRSVAFAAQTQQYFDEKLPLRDGLREIELTNEVGKYPSVVFQLYVPEFRKQGRELGGAKDGSVIDTFRVGRKFYVKWGYNSAHTQWGPFRVTERSIDFSEGTALLTVKGMMGHRLKMTTSAEVFTASYGKSAIEQIADLCDLPIRRQQLLEEEYDNLLKESAMPAGNDMGLALWRESSKADVDMFFDPERNQLVLSSPFKMELVKRGDKPIRMTYGVPTSMISSIEVETKTPKRKGTGKTSGKGVEQDASVDPTKKSKTKRFLYAGALLTSNGSVFVLGNYPREQQSLGAPSIVYKAESPEQALELARTNFPSSQGYDVKINDSLPTSIGGADVYDISVYKTVSISADSFDEENWFVTDQQYSDFVRQANEGVLVIEPTGAPEFAEGVFKLKIKVYRPKNTSSEVQGDKKVETTKTDTTSEATPKSTESKEGEEYEVLDSLGETNLNRDEFYIQSRILVTEPSHLSDADRKKREDFLGWSKALEEKAKGLGDEYRFGSSPIKDTGQTRAYIYQVKTRTNPAEPSSGDSDEAPIADTATASTDTSQPKPVFTPKSQMSGGGSVSSRKSSLMKLTLNLKAGDWTMRVGKLLEIVDLYKSLNGVYYISKETHTIDTSGFNTVVECKRATSKQISTYGSSPVKSKSKPTTSPIETQSTRQPVVMQPIIFIDQDKPEPMKIEEKGLLSRFQRDVI